MAIFDFLRATTDKDRFAKQIMRRLRDRGWSESIQYDRDHFALTLGTGRRMFLHNVFGDWSAASAAEKSSQLDRAIAFVFEPETGDAFEHAVPNLLPVIRSRSSLANQWLDPALGMERNWYDGALRPFCDGLAVIAAIDQPTSVGFVNRRQLSKWSKSLDEVLAIAMGNLAERSRPSRFESVDTGLYVSSFEDYYDASRLLIPRLFEEIPLPGDPVAIAVSRSGVVVAGSEDPDALNAMATFVEDRSEEETRPISNLPLVLRNGEWRLFDCSGAGLEPLDRLRAMQWLQDYADQKALLDPYFERIGRDVYVAKLSGIRDGGRIRTWATWTSEAVSLLPEADAVAMRRDGDTIVRHWSDIVENCGPLNLEDGLYPRRYLVKAGPDDAAWERLGRCEHPSWFPPLGAKA